MARYVNSETGSVVNIDDDTAAQLGPEWKKGKDAGPKPSAQENSFGVAANAVPVESEAEPQPAPASKASAKKS